MKQGIMYLILPKQAHEFIYMLCCDTINNFTIVFHQLHHHVGCIQSYHPLKLSKQNVLNIRLTCRITIQEMYCVYFNHQFIKILCIQFTLYKYKLTISDMFLEFFFKLGSFFLKTKCCVILLNSFYRSVCSHYCNRLDRGRDI